MEGKQLRGLDALGRQMIWNMVNSGEDLSSDDIKDAINKVAVTENFDKVRNTDFIRQLHLAGHRTAATHLEIIST